MNRVVESVQKIAQQVAESADLTIQQRIDIDGVVSASQTVDELIQGNERSSLALIESTQSLNSVSTSLNELAHQMNDQVHQSDKFL